MILTFGIKVIVWWTSWEVCTKESYNLNNSKIYKQRYIPPTILNQHINFSLWNRKYNQSKLAVNSIIEIDIKTTEWPRLVIWLSITLSLFCMVSIYIKIIFWAVAFIFMVDNNDYFLRFITFPGVHSQLPMFVFLCYSALLQKCEYFNVVRELHEMICCKKKRGKKLFYIEIFHIHI